MNRINELLETLRNKTEGCTMIDADGSEWGTVYLDNAFAGAGYKSHHQFAGDLSALKAQGVYRPIDGDFGEVLLA